MQSPDSLFKGKSAFVLGGAGLIGKEVSLEFSKLGAQVLILDKDKRNSEKIIKEMQKYNKNSSFLYFDCSDMEKLEQQLKEVISIKSVPHIFVNCSYPRTKDWTKSSFKKITLNSFRKNVDIHLNSYAWTAKFIADAMSKKKIKGSIVLMSSVYGLKVQDISMYEETNLDENMAYPPIKAAIIHLSKQMAAFYGSSGIRVNSVCPGGIEGPIAGKKDLQDKVFIKRYIDKTPLGRMTNPKEIANLTVFLSSDAASYITGQAIVIDGGFSLS